MLDDIPEDLLPVIHEHWRKFPPQHPLIKDAFGLMFGMLFIVALLGNLCVIFVFLGTKRLRTPVSKQRISFLEIKNSIKGICVYSQISSLSTWLSPIY